LGVSEASGEDGRQAEALGEVLFAVVEGRDRNVAGRSIEGEDQILDTVGVELGAQRFDQPTVEFLASLLEFFKVAVGVF
jgi:hypothetical protein